MRSSRKDDPPLGASSFPSPPPRSPGRANLANTALPSPAGLRPASRLNQNLADSGIPLRFGPSAGRSSWRGVKGSIAASPTSKCLDDARIGYSTPSAYLPQEIHARLFRSIRRDTGSELACKHWRPKDLPVAGLV